MPSIYSSLFHSFYYLRSSAFALLSCGLLYWLISGSIISYEDYSVFLLYYLFMTLLIPREPYSQDELARLYPKQLKLQLVQVVSSSHVLPGL